MTQGIEEQIGTLSAVKAKYHFVQIGLEMLCGDVVPRSHDSTLEKRERGFGGIGVDQTGDIFFLVADRLVLCPLFFIERERIDCRFIGDDHFHIFAEMVSKNLAHSLGFDIGCMNQAKLATALTDANDYFLSAARHMTAGLSANIRFVNLDRAVQHRSGLFHGRANPMAEIPCRFVASDSESALNLASGHTLFGFAEQQGCQKPFSEWQVR